MKALIFLLLSLSTFASHELEQCEVDYRNFGDEAVNEGCYELWSKSLISPQLKDLEEGRILATPTALFFHDGKKLYIQAGSYSAVDSPLAITYSKELKTIATLESNGDIKLYHSHLMGNIPPKKIIKNKRVFGAIDIAFIPDGLAVFNKKENKILIIGLENTRVPASQEVIKEFKVQESHIISISYDNKKQRLQGLTPSGEYLPL